MQRLTTVLRAETIANSLSQKENPSKKVATDSPLQPGSFPLGSVQSRAAARRVLRDREQSAPPSPSAICVEWILAYALLPGFENGRVYVGPWRNLPDGRFFRVVYIPRDLVKDFQEELCGRGCRIAVYFGPWTEGGDELNAVHAALDAEMTQKPRLKPVATSLFRPDSRYILDGTRYLTSPKPAG